MSCHSEGHYDQTGRAWKKRPGTNIRAWSLWKWIGAPEFNFLAHRCAVAILLIAIFATLTQSFCYGIDNQLDGKLTLTGRGQFIYAVCGILTREKYGAGRYICSISVQHQLQDVGLGYDDTTLARIGKTVQDWLADTAFLNTGLKKAFALSPLPTDGGARAYGWGGDSGYMDFVEYAFWLFGKKIQALYYGFFLLFMISTLLFCIQFRQNLFALFAALALQASILQYLHVLPLVRVDSVNSPRFLSVLALTPLLHALFLVAYRVPANRGSIAIFTLQAMILAAAADFRSLTFSTALALTLTCLLLLLLDLRRTPLVRALRRYWPLCPIALCVVTSFMLQAAAADPRIAVTHSMRYHTFWEPLYFDLQHHPQWVAKYAAEHHWATGDDTAYVAATTYRQRHGLMDNKEDFVNPNNGDDGINELAYEKYVRKAYIEFVQNDPWYVLQLKSYDALTAAIFVGQAVRRTWSSMGWWFFVVATVTASVLIAQVRRKSGYLVNMSLCSGLLGLSAILIAVPVTAMVVDFDLLTDPALLAAAVSFVLALYAVVWAGVLVPYWAALLMRHSDRASPL
jgi:hypothetical protein